MKGLLDEHIVHLTNNHMFTFIKNVFRKLTDSPPSIIRQDMDWVVDMSRILYDKLNACNNLKDKFCIYPCSFNTAMPEIFMSNKSCTNSRVIVALYLDKGYTPRLRATSIRLLTTTRSRYAEIVTTSEWTCTTDAEHNMNRLTEVLIKYYNEEWSRCPWDRRKYAVWVASNRSPNKEHLLYQLPQDVSRMVISYL